MSSVNLGLDLRLIGNKRLEKKLANLERKIGKKVMRDSAIEAMEPVKDLAKARCPVDTGRLKNSIKVVAYSGDRGRIQSAQVRTGTRKQLRIKANAKYYYPAAIEYGTRKRAARSFLRSALGDLRTSVIKNLSVNVARRLKKI